MAYDKAVDSAQLDADLTLVADAIRTKGGTDAQLVFPSGFVSAVQAFEIGSGNHGIIARDVFTATESMTIFEVLNAVEVKCTYKNSLLLMGCYDDVTPDKGSYTLGNYTMWHLGTDLFRTFHNYFNGAVSFSRFVNGGVFENIGGFTIDAYSRLRRATASSTSCCVAAGGTFKFIEIPLNRYTFAQDMTLWGET